jgi:hypothetical protein
MMVLQCRLLASAAVACPRTVLPTEQLEVLIACTVAFPPAFMETLTSPLERADEQRYIGRVIADLPPPPPLPPLPPLSPPSPPLSPTLLSTTTGMRLEAAISTGARSGNRLELPQPNRVGVSSQTLHVALPGRELMLKRVHGLFRSDCLVAALAAAPHPALAVLEIARLAVSNGVHASDPRGSSPVAVGGALSRSPNLTPPSHGIRACSFVWRFVLCPRVCAGGL